MPRSLILLFAILVTGISCDCVKYIFENDFYELFTNEWGPCDRLALWDVGYYNETNLTPPDERSVSFISPQQTLSCVSSFIFPMQEGGLIEVNIFLDGTSISDEVVVRGYRLVSGEDVEVGSGLNSPITGNFVSGWHTLSFNIEGEGTFDGYITLLGSASVNSVVLVDSFRYIPPDVNESMCQLYEYETTTIGIYITAEPNVTPQIPITGPDTTTLGATMDPEVSTLTSLFEVDTSTHMTTFNTDTTTVQLETIMTTPVIETNTQTSTTVVDTNTQTSTNNVDTSAQTTTTEVDSNTHTSTSEVNTNTQTSTNKDDKDTQISTTEVDKDTQTFTAPINDTTQAVITEDYITTQIISIKPEIPQSNDVFWTTLNILLAVIIVILITAVILFAISRVILKRKRTVKTSDFIDIVNALTRAQTLEKKSQL